MKKLIKEKEYLNHNRQKSDKGSDINAKRRKKKYIAHTKTYVRNESFNKTYLSAPRDCRFIDNAEDFSTFFAELRKMSNWQPLNGGKNIVSIS